MQRKAGRYSTVCTPFSDAKKEVFKTKEPGQARMTDSPAKDRRERILVVEEEEYLRILIFQMLAKLGYKATLACSGEEGLKKFHQGSYDLVLSDLTMSSMDGWTLARHIKEKSTKTRVCLMTGWGEVEIRPKISGSAADFAIFKPFALHTLQKTIENILGP